jgi:hypothetical protein
VKVSFSESDIPLQVLACPTLTLKAGEVADVEPWKVEQFKRELAGQVVCRHLQPNGSIRHYVVTSLSRNYTRQSGDTPLVDLLKIQEDVS